MTTTCYVSISKSADVWIGFQESLPMPVSDAVTNQFETELDQGDPHSSCESYYSPNPGLPSHPDVTDWELCNSEPYLGCARGVLWALFFEAALVVAGVIYWKFHLSR